MTQALGIDTLAFARKLKEAGADERLAEAIAEGIGTVDMSEFATKADLAALGVKLTAEIRASSADLKSEILKWMFSAMAVQTALLVTLIKLI